MESWKRPTEQTVDRALSLLVREPDRRRFYGKLRNPLWLSPLIDRGVFKAPPESKGSKSEAVGHPSWPELIFLANIAEDVPEEVVNVIQDLPETDNSQVNWQVVGIALRLPPMWSAELADLINSMIGRRQVHDSFQLQDLLEHWVAGEQFAVGISLAKTLLTFDPDPELQTKRAAWTRKGPLATPNLIPTARLESWSYQQVARVCITDLADHRPLDVAFMLLDVASDMLANMWQPDSPQLANGVDFSEIWCRRLDREISDHDADDATLIRALVIACRRLFETDPVGRSKFARAIAKKRWAVYKRIHHYLLGAFLGDWCKSFVHDAVLQIDDIGRNAFRSETKELIRGACEMFGGQLFSATEWRQLSDRILAGPSKPKYKNFLGDVHTDELYEQHRLHFHFHQLEPFRKALPEKELEYLTRLESEIEFPDTVEPEVSDDEVRFAWVQEVSPFELNTLRRKGDEDLLDLINKWGEEREDPADWARHISFKGFAEAIEDLFEEVIVQAPERIEFWADNFSRIERPIFARALIRSFKRRFAEKHFECWQLCMAMCQSVIEHPDGVPPNMGEDGDSGGELNSWHDARMAVGDLVDELFNDGVEPPVEMRKAIESLLGEMCTQYDWRLDEGHTVLLGRDDQLTEAINTLRSKALMRLIEFGLWSADIGADDGVEATKAILDSRLSGTHAPAMTLPERAATGMYTGKLLRLSQTWFEERKRSIFVRGNMRAWSESFGNFLRAHRPHRAYWAAMQDEFEFASKNVKALKIGDSQLGDPRVALGGHLMAVHIWGFIPGSGIPSVLRQYFDELESHPKVLSKFFGQTGETVGMSAEHLSDQQWGKVNRFLKWRIVNGSSQELSEFWRWVRADGLDAHWSLDWCEQIFDRIDFDSIDGFAGHFYLEWLAEVVDVDTKKVVNCLTKLTSIPQSAIHHLREKHVKVVINAGLKSEDDAVVGAAKNARDALLRKGRLDLLDLN